MEQYRQLKNDISLMLDNLDALEEKLIARMIYWSRESCMSVIQTKLCILIAGFVWATWISDIEFEK